MIRVSCRPEKDNSSSFLFSVDYCDEEHRTLIDNQRKVFTASNGWKVIFGLNLAPHVLWVSKAIFIYGSDGRHDGIMTYCECKNAIHMGSVITAIKGAISEFNSAVKEGSPLSESRV